MYASKPEEFKELVITQVRQMRSDDLRYVLRTPNSDECSHLITRMEPSSTSRSLAAKTIASSGVFKLLWDVHLKIEFPIRHTSTISSSMAAQSRLPLLGGSLNSGCMNCYFIKLLPFRLRRSTIEGRKFDIYDKCADSHEPNFQFQLPVSPEYPLYERIKLEPTATTARVPRISPQLTLCYSSSPPMDLCPSCSCSR